MKYHACLSLQKIPGVSPIPDGYNPATWMLEVTTPAAEERIGVDFANIYVKSEQFRLTNVNICNRFFIYCPFPLIELFIIMFPMLSALGR